MSDWWSGLGFVGVAIVLEAIAQVAFKKTAGHFETEAGILVALRAAFARGWIVLGIAFFVLELGASTMALRFLPVSVAFPLGSLELVIVTLMSKLWLGEIVSPRRWAGVGLLLVGTALVGSN